MKVGSTGLCLCATRSSSTHNAGVFQTGAMLVGAHAYGALLNTLGVKPRRNYTAEDIEIARDAPIQLVMIPKGGARRCCAGPACRSWKCGADRGDR